ncbi:FtsQ-type POTRA domain-containing protein [bacterium]|nr:FtsQ-type POTRA domain-containing protein [bacterium]
MIALISIIFLTICWYATPFFIFPLRHLVILGNFYISEDEIRGQLNQLLGTPIYKIHPKTVLSLLSDQPWLKKVIIYTLPPGRLLLKIVERKPFLLVCTEDGNPLLVDEEGYIIQNPAQLTHFPTLVLPSLRWDRKNRISLPVFKQIKEVIERLSDTPIKIAKLYLTPQDELKIFTEGGLEIKMGEVKDITTKLIILKALWERIPNIENRIEYVNLSCPSAPAIMEKVSK